MLHPWRSVFRSQALEGMDRAGIAWRAAFTSASIGGMRAAVAAGFGVALLSEGNLGDELHAICPRPACRRSRIPRSRCMWWAAAPRPARGCWRQ
ncbi:LysR substrate-binding domain-containing protein [Roseococcus sp. SYP-B2431]|uniref:LysR substrate-binding domain-containing protein n=1 Tax=Roseococcus sp. SYP-B2431 TaxID=2496640 RepID=UPI001F0FE4E1|nr:LysR substrate-binding domain-containing protein [Roseococcus sp. SYP-B2431]